ncbi:wHTH domain-containing protein [Streptomyces coeruleorubidus]|uniref:wHTH domain-containing protein n=1 Tax=Streptomyces coeruleorubidus TaxID=116188 RepID=UPI0037ABA34E
MAGAQRYDQALTRLIEWAGNPSAAELREEIAKDLERGRRPPDISTINSRLAGAVPRDRRHRHEFLKALARIAHRRNGTRLPLPTLTQWDSMAEEARKSRLRRPSDAGDAPAGTPPSCPEEQDWQDDTAQSQAWQFVRSETEERAAAMKEQARKAAGRLAELYGPARALLADDPWHDPDLARRIAHRTNLLLYQLRCNQQGILDPAEAALLALLPFLHQVHSAHTAVALSHVDPTDLEEQPSGSPERRAYEVLLRSHKRLVRQAMRGDTLKDRADGRREIGWWLFHQWAKGQPGDIQAVLRAAGGAGTDIATVCRPELVSRLLACARVAPRKLYGRGLAGSLREEPFQLDFDGRDWQQVREWLVGPLFAIAHALAIEVTDLPPAVVRHVGIPDSLDLERLFTTVGDASWTTHRDVLGLKAVCDHPAAVAALSEHTELVDTLLRGARRAKLAEEVGALPVYAHADEVHEADDRAGPGPAGEVIRFRLDEERIQELLMGENLYRDRSLAIRELYQNALDACRYRRARQHARDGRDTYDGEITFVQDFDEKEGRYYLECRDDGIGMDETVLADVFSRAGVRFTDLPRYQEEQQDWERQGITVHPNSRFGIGVLSYFMIADEIRVTTCAMDGGIGRPEELTVLITGPGHYFRVRRTGRKGPVGTKVRLYLRDGDKAPSCVRELRRLLGLAEFRTTARHGKQEATWKPGELRLREVPGNRAEGFVAHGQTVAWPAGAYEPDGQVIWCQDGGGILVDGIYTEPRVRRGVLTDPGDHRRLRGVVVNLTGGTRPRDLSVDRTEILDEDVCGPVEELLRAALPALLAADPPLLEFDWLSEVAGRSPRLADIVTETAGEAGFEMDLHGHPAPVARVGFFPPDVFLVHRADSDVRESQTRSASTPAGQLYGSPDDATLLWRLLAHRPNAELSVLTELVPELARVEAVLDARPSDVLLRSDHSGDWNDRSWTEPEEQADVMVRPGHALSVALACGMSYDAAVSRLEQLSLPAPGRASSTASVDPTGVALLDREHGLERGGSWCTTAEPVQPGHLLKAALVLNISADEAARRMRAFGFTVSHEGMPTDTPEEWVVSLLSRDLDGESPWLDLSEPVTAGHVLSAVRRFHRPFGEVVEVLRAYGFHPEVGALDEQSAEELLRQAEEWGWGANAAQYLDVGQPVPPGFLASAALVSDVPLHDIARRIAEFGFSVGAHPERAEPTDPAILGFDAQEPQWREADDTVGLASLADAAHTSGLPPAAVADRLRAYGLRVVSTELPERAEPDDVAVLGQVLSYAFHRAEVPDEPVPMVAVLRAAQDLGKSPRAVVDRLARYGLRTSCPTAPAKASRYDTELVSLWMGDPSLRTVLGWDDPVPLYHLVSAPHALLMEPEEVADRLSAFGLQVPVEALDGLDEVDRRLCLEEHEQDGDGIALPLSLRDPIRDFLRIARFSGLPLDDLLPRLTRLGVDLPRVVDAVRAALPRVPGLVMASEAASVTPQDPAEGCDTAETAHRV